MIQRSRPAFAFEFLADVGIVVSYAGVREVEEPEWEEYAELLRSVSSAQRVRCLWYTEGARPSRERQQSLSKAVPRCEWPVAVVSPSAAMRFVVSAFSLSNRNLRYFTPNELPQALRHIDCTTAEQAAVQHVLARLRDKLG